VTIIASAVYIGAARRHRQIKESTNRHRIWLGIKRTHIARMDLDWEHIPAALPVEHPIALEIDLDLVGDHSLHRLIDTSSSIEGAGRLRAWLSVGTPDPAIINQRQALVRELVSIPVFRDKLRLAATRESNRRWEGNRILRWLDRVPPAQSLGTIILLLFGLAVINEILFLLTQFTGLPPYYGLSFILYAGIYFWQVQRLGDPFDAAMDLSDPLNHLKSVFHYLETAPYGDHPNLRALCAPFLQPENRPSTHLRRVTWVISAASLRRNPLLWTMISAMMPWDLIVAHWLEKRRAEVSALLPVWLDRWFELEALGSLANLGYLNPDYTFAEWNTDNVIEAQSLGHPLIPDKARVSNSFTLNHIGELALITGSNMSGKSTFLRAVGLNLCLAYTGGPVNARQFRVMPLRLRSCIRVTDSITDGISYFYAEVKCLKAVLQALEEDHPLPLFFLIDEIFRGTNNRERLIGSRAYIRALIGHHGAGILSTHDLELVRLADEMPAIKNYHFSETIADNKMLFDYTLRSGPCPTTNALKIMQMEGLPVEL
jgi:hypothetical protein